MHDLGRIDLFIGDRLGGTAIWFKEELIRASILRAINQVPQSCPSHGVEDEMDPPFVTIIADAVAMIGVKCPALSRLHVHGLVGAHEGHLRVGDDRDVYPQVRAPVIMAVHVRRHFASRPQAHQAAAAPHSAELGHGLTLVLSRWTPDQVPGVRRRRRSLAVQADTEASSRSFFVLPRRQEPGPNVKPGPPPFAGEQHSECPEGRALRGKSRGSEGHRCCPRFRAQRPGPSAQDERNPAMRRIGTACRTFP